MSTDEPDDSGWPRSANLAAISPEMNSASWQLPLAFLLIALVVILSRLFFLGTSYGSNPDAWRSFSASQHLSATGVYEPSRFPGYPLPEYFGTLLIKGGVSSAFGFELPVAILSGVAIGVFFLILRPLGFFAAVGSSLALAFTPVFFIASTASLDYVYGFTFFMIAALAAFRGNILWASVFLGLAAASRPTYALAYLPLALNFLVLSFNRETIYGNLRKLIIFAAVSGAIAFIFYAQLFYEYGIAFLTFYDRESHVFFIALGNLALGVFGLIGSVGIALGMAASAFALVKRKWQLKDHRQLLLFSATTAAIYLPLFFRLPDEAAYFIPVLPAVYIWLAVALSPWVTLALPAVLLASCFFLHVDREGNGVVLDWRGPIVMDQLNQQILPCIATEVAAGARSLDASSYVLSGYFLPMLEVLLPHSLSSRLVYSIDAVTPTGYVVHGSTWVNTKPTLPPNSRFLTIDRADSYVRSLSPALVPISGTIDTMRRCPNRT